MPRGRLDSRFARRLVVATLTVALVAPAAARGQIRADPSALSAVPAALRDRLRGDPFVYFRFVNRAWTARVCEVFADVPNPAVVRLHGDAHVEQFALTRDAWGLDDFDDSARGPAYIDIVRFLGSIDLAARQRGWSRDRDALWTRFFQGYRKGLSDSTPDSHSKDPLPEPDIVRRLRRESPRTRAAYLAWGDQLMQPIDDATLTIVATALAGLDRLVLGERSDLPRGYFAVRRAGWLRVGVGSASARKILIRVQGPTSAPDDD